MNGDTWRGLAWGFGLGVVVTLLARLLFPSLGVNTRPLAKRMIKSAIEAYNRGRTMAAEMREDTEDLVAEAALEVAQERLHEKHAGASGNGTGSAGRAADS